MTGEVIPFPRVRSRLCIARRACRMTEMSSEAAERHLRLHLQIMAEPLRGMGTTAEVVADKLYSTECAIRAELWQSVITSGGAA